MVAVIPHSLPLANAAVLPLCYSTAGCALFKHLKLPLPSLDPKPVEKTILLWGGSSSVGCSAIQYVQCDSSYIIFEPQTFITGSFSTDFGSKD
jgi:NADPH:quinone reductase-like Zn-dependent oxidoreductase